MRALLLSVTLLAWTSRPLAAEHAANNMIIFVADGLRGAMVDARLTPNMDLLRREGVSFPNSHALFPTVTTANASAIATGHLLGDTGDFANTIYAGFPARLASGGTSVTPFLEDDVVLGDMDNHFAGNYLTETTLLAMARKSGFSTAALGKVGPTLIQDHTERSGEGTIEIDDRSGLTLDDGTPEGILQSSALRDALQKAGLPATPPAADRPNLAQQQYFADVATKVVLPMFKQRGRPFVLMFWMRDPDVTQHGQLDSRHGLVPGINGSSSLAAIHNTDAQLGQLRAALKTLALDASTDIFVTSDHGFSTISKQSDTSHTLKCRFDGVQPGFLPPGFLSLDIADALNLPLWDPDANNASIDYQSNCGSAGPAQGDIRPKHTRFGSALIGRDPAHPELVVTAGAGAALIYVEHEFGSTHILALTTFLLSQDYVGGVFLDPAFGRIPGTLSLTDLGLVGNASTPHPSIVVSFRSFSTGCDQALRCGAEVSDTTLSQGQGMHGAFSRADTFNFMAAVGPDFRKRFVDPAPVSNADIAPTISRILGLRSDAKGKLTGRVINEVLPGGKMPAISKRTCFYPAIYLGRGARLDEPPLLHLQPAVATQTVGEYTYFDAAGIVGRTLGLDALAGKQCRHKGYNLCCDIM